MPSSSPGFMTLSFADSKRIADGAIAQAKELGILISVAVCDAGGRLIVFERMDGAAWASVQGAKGKALVSAGFNMSSGRLDGPGGPGHARLFGGQDDSRNMVYVRGAVAVFRDGLAVGACGVAGGTTQQDEACARAGVSKLTPARA